MPNRNIYAIVDNVANDIVGPLWTMRNDTIAIRQFGEIAASKDNQVSRHINDHDLVSLGEIDDDTLKLTPNYFIVLTGTTWAATQAKEQPTLAL